MAKSEILNNDALTVRVSEDILEHAEKALDAAENALDVAENVVERVVTVTRNNPWLIAGAAVIGLAVGSFVGYKYATKRLRGTFDAQLEVELEEAKEYYAKANKTGVYSTPESAAAVLIPEAAQGLREYQGREKIQYNTPVTQPDEAELALAKEPNYFDYEAEAQRRQANPGEPYVISFDEFEANPDGHEQVSLTYYEGDEVLADVSETPVDDPNRIVGLMNLARFGEGAHDSNTVYIRNERMEADYEINRSRGMYSVEVLGGVTEGGELRHADHRIRHHNRTQSSKTPRKFRETDG